MDLRATAGLKEVVSLRCPSRSPPARYFSQHASTSGTPTSVHYKTLASAFKGPFSRASTPRRLHSLGADSREQDQQVPERLQELEDELEDIAEAPIVDLKQAVPAPAAPQKKSGLAGAGSKLVLGLAALAGTTLLIALFRVFQRSKDPKVKQQILGRKNKLVVESLVEYLPQRRQELSPKHARRLCSKTGFKPEEVFRKYLWYLLKERSFDRTALDDIVHLKQVLNLSDSQVADAIYARAERIFKRYGPVMLQTTGMTTAGVERKATTRVLYSKLLYLTEYEPLCGSSPAPGEEASITKLFGLTDKEARELRIESIEEDELQ